MKVLITTNPLDHEGGIVNYYRVFFETARSGPVDFTHLPFGSRMEYFYSPWKKAAVYPFYFLVDYWRLIVRLLSDRTIRVVQVSPSLIPVPLFRDALILLGAKLLGRHVVVFFRGWKKGVVHSLKSNALFRWLFRLVYGRADATLVLASRFRDDLIEIGMDAASIRVTTTVYDAGEILPLSDRSGQLPRLLFVGRVSQLKGVEELIDAASILVDRGVEFECAIVGHEDKAGVTNRYVTRVQELGLDDRLKFLGRLTGRSKFEMYSNSDIFVLPSWTEGCPNSVLEALGSGLFVVSTDVGALPDIIESEVNGKTVSPKDSKSLAHALEWACAHVDDIRGRRTAIQEHAASRYEAKWVFAQLGEFYEKLIND